VGVRWSASPTRAGVVSLQVERPQQTVLLWIPQMLGLCERNNENAIISRAVHDRATMGLALLGVDKQLETFASTLIYIYIYEKCLVIHFYYTYFSSLSMQINKYCLKIRVPLHYFYCFLYLLIHVNKSKIRLWWEFTTKYFYIYLNIILVRKLKLIGLDSLKYINYFLFYLFIYFFKCGTLTLTNALIITCESFYIFKSLMRRKVVPSTLAHLSNLKY
jgi:hypothetical protein